ncbi:MAG: tRNA (N(6)-L-threonylcarbamoyladenosine(37)-C(2))-methylthiotransferase MtaB [Planctomycetaceae bacterium]|nr:tRNA (N(6)-L-threonylcarbamoyladenosine(37)-C(2))-methylthiotransferase MtaB [Planctomycetaceae bacterium]
MKYLLQTFGCKSNQYESQAIRESLNAAGHDEAATADEACLLIINTCGVTGRAGASCRNAIRKMVRLNPGLRVVVTGCGVDLKEEWPDLPIPPLLVPNAKKHAIAKLLADLDGNPVEAEPADRFALGITEFQGHTRAFIKIQDGCDNFCTYCAVPYARGVPESRPLSAILDEARRLLASGHRELVLTGINIGAYDRDGLRLADVADSLAALPGLERLRLGSVEPPHLDERLVAVMAANPSICPHVHLPLQSGDDAILAAMGRRYDTGGFMRCVELLRRQLDNPAITTDIIVGFPGEDDTAAAATRDLCREAGFSRMHVFLFSPRQGTPAASLRQTCTNRTIEERKSALITVGHELAARYAASCVGMRERIIMEKSGTGLSDRYVATTLDGDPAEPGAVVRVAITGSDVAGLIATRV